MSPAVGTRYDVAFPLSVPSTYTFMRWICVVSLPGSIYPPLDPETLAKGINWSKSPSGVVWPTKVRLCAPPGAVIALPPLACPSPPLLVPGSIWNETLTLPCWTT